MSDKKEKCPFTNKPYDCKNCKGHTEDWTGKGNHKIHMGHSVSGPIMRNNKKDWAEMAQYTTKEDGSHFCGQELQIEFMKMYQDGKETIPLSACDRFCFKNGCQGHASD